MKIPGRCRKYQRKSGWAMIAIVAAILMIGFAPAFGASAGDNQDGTTGEATHGEAVGGDSHGSEVAAAEGGHGEAAAEEGSHGEAAAEGGHGEGAAEGGHGAEQSKPWMKTDTAKVLNFAILAIGLFLVLRKPVGQALNDRIKGIKEELEELENRKADVEKQLAEYDTKLATLDEEAEKVIAEYVRQGEEAKVRILKEAESAADKLEEQAKKNIENEFKQAKETLQAEIVEKALVKAELAVKDKISADDQERLVDEYLAKVVA